jgi:hypothetical protein
MKYLNKIAEYTSYAVACTVLFYAVFTYLMFNPLFWFLVEYINVN